MSRNLALIALASLTACGGQTLPDAAPQCSGTPRAAIVFVGVPATPHANACVIAAGTEVAAAADEVRAAAGTHRAYVIGAGAGARAALDAMATRPGLLDTASLWLVEDTAVASLHGRITTVYLNGGPACQELAASISAQGTPALCDARATAYDAAAALSQLQLPAAP